MAIADAAQDCEADEPGQRRSSGYFSMPLPRRLILPLAAMTLEVRFLTSHEHRVPCVTLMKMPCSHDVMVDMPSELADELLKLV